MPKPYVKKLKNELLKFGHKLLEGRFWKLLVDVQRRSCGQLVVSRFSTGNRIADSKHFSFRYEFPDNIPCLFRIVVVVVGRRQFCKSPVAENSDFVGERHLSTQGF